MQFILRLLITAAALWVAVYLVPTITFDGPWHHLVGVALVFGVVNAIVRPIILSLTCPLVLLTLGLFIFVLNGLMLLLTGALASALGIDFQVNSILGAIIGALIIGVVSTVLNVFVGTKPARR
ncbi:MAG TPA: phage holin family protein [Longimicrobiales bacterium]|nr:phage holin family protein [Longimicrobiales bacterium]